MVAERTCQRVARLALSGPAHEPLRISLSLGHATLAPGTPFGSVAALLEAADAALFAAKRAGRDRAVAA